MPSEIFSVEDVHATFAALFGEEIEVYDMDHAPYYYYQTEGIYSRVGDFGGPWWVYPMILSIEETDTGAVVEMIEVNALDKDTPTHIWTEEESIDLSADNFAEVTAHAQALVLNIGQPSPRKLDAMLRSGEQAGRMGIPVVLDPVGVGVSSLRTTAVRQILERVHIAVLRCNHAEAACIYGMHPDTRGVDSDRSLSLEDSESLARGLAARYRCAVALTGATDLVASPSHLCKLEGGHPMLSRVTGMGCVSTVLCACYAAVTDDSLLAAAAGLGAISAAGEIAYQNAGRRGTGSFRTAVIDALSQMDAAALHAHLKLTEVPNAL